MKNCDQEIEVTVETDWIGYPEEQGGNCYIYYVLRINNEYLVDGWKVVGWIKPGQQNHDGSQGPEGGGWSACDSDGQSCGLPKAIAKSSFVSIHHGYGLTEKKIKIKTNQPEELAKEINNKIQELLESEVDSFGQPELEDIFEHLSKNEICSNIVCGDFIGAGKCAVAKNYSGEYKLWPFPDVYDIEDVLKFILDDLKKYLINEFDL